MQTSDAAADGRIYLDCALLRPADILLTTQRHLVSGAIRMATRGPFSHAALILELTVMLEADGYGTGHTMLIQDRVEQLNNPRRGRLLHRLSASTTAAKVLRRPGLADSRPNLFKELEDLTTPFLWKEYPALCRTAAVFNEQHTKKTLILPFLRILDKYAARVPENPGAFCSELVAAIFETLGFPLIPGVRPDEISPNAIATAPGFVEVEGAITQPDPSAELREDLREIDNAVMKVPFPRELLSELVDFMNLVARLNAEAAKETTS